MHHCMLMYVVLHLCTLLFMIIVLLDNGSVRAKTCQSCSTMYTITDFLRHSAFIGLNQFFKTLKHCYYYNINMSWKQNWKNYQSILFWWYMLSAGGPAKPSISFSMLARAQWCSHISRASHSALNAALGSGGIAIAAPDIWSWRCRAWSAARNKQKVGSCINIITKIIQKKNLS